MSEASGRARAKYPTRGPQSQTARARNGQTSSYLGRVRATRVRVRDRVRIRIRDRVRVRVTVTVRASWRELQARARAMREI